MSGPLNYTTTVAADKSAMECLGILGRSGAAAIAVTYTAKRPTGLAFRLDTVAGQRDFTLPVNISGVHKALIKANRTGGMAPRYATAEQAERVAWRILKDWLEAQLAIIDAEMVTLDEVMLPYLQVGDGRSLYAEFAERNGLMLEAGRG